MPNFIVEKAGSSRGLRYILIIFLASATAVHVWVVMFIRHRSWQADEFLDYPLGCDDTPQCARFGSNLFGKGLVSTHDLFVALYDLAFRETLRSPRLRGVNVEIALSAELLTRFAYVAILAVGICLVYRQLLGSVMVSLAAINSLLFIFSGFYLPLSIQIVDRFEQLSLFSQSFRMQELGFLMHYDYLITPAYLSSIFILKSIQDNRMKYWSLFVYAFLLGSIYEALIPVVVLGYLIFGYRSRTISGKYLSVLIAGQGAATAVAYIPQFGNGDANWINRSINTYGVGNFEYLPQLVVLFTIIFTVSFGVGYLLSWVLYCIGARHFFAVITKWRDSINYFVVGLLVVHILGFFFAGYSEELFRQSLGLQAMTFTLGISICSQKLRALQPDPKPV